MPNNDHNATEILDTVWKDRKHSSTQKIIHLDGILCELTVEIWFEIAKNLPSMLFPILSLLCIWWQVFLGFYFKECQYKLHNSIEFMSIYMFNGDARIHLIWRPMSWIYGWILNSIKYVSIGLFSDHIKLLYCSLKRLITHYHTLHNLLRWWCVGLVIEIWFDIAKNMPSTLCSILSLLCIWWQVFPSFYFMEYQNKVYKIYQ